MSDSSVRLLSACSGTRLIKSWNDANLPEASRSATMSAAAPSPTLRILDKPKLTADSPATGAKSTPDSLMSGVRTTTPLAPASDKYKAALSLLPFTEVSKQAK